MLLLPHTLAGMAIASLISNPFLAVPLAFISHFILDKTPHWDFYSNTKKEERLKGWRPLAVMADLIIGVAVGLTMTFYYLWVVKDASMALNIFLCGIASVLPDALEGPYIFMGREPKILSFLTNIQRKMQFQAPLPWGLLTQLVVIILATYTISVSFF